MKIAFLHYHLKTGGVTTVIHQQIEALKNDCECLVLTGEPVKTNSLPHVVHIPGIGYDTNTGQQHTPRDVAKAIQAAIFSRWKDGCDILHVHNPTLAKNKNLLSVLSLLQQEGITLFLQLHDLAEDGRPLIYYANEPYPENCHYGVINSRDYRILVQAGFKKNGLHKIFNTVAAFDKSNFIDDSVPKGTLLYPVRAIRRKNIGEAILLSQVGSPHLPLAITRPPNSPADITSYSGWKSFCKTLRLPIIFDASARYGFTNLVFSATAMISTSISEGFGFSFLEPWTAGKSLWGRKLDICQDFEQNGIILDNLYTHFYIPLTWIGKDTWHYTWHSAIRRSCEQFGLQLDIHLLTDWFEQTIQNGCVDFGLLNEALQKQAVALVLSQTHARHMLIDLNPWLRNYDISIQDSATIQHNTDKIARHYNNASYRHTLLNIYHTIKDTSVQHRIDKRAVVTEFLKPENYSLLKWSPYVE